MPIKDSNLGNFKQLNEQNACCKNWTPSLLPPPKAFTPQRGPAAKGISRDAKRHGTRGSRVIPQRSTNLAQLCLTSEIGRDRVYSEWYDRGMRDLEDVIPCTLTILAERQIISPRDQNQAIIS